MATDGVTALDVAHVPDKTADDSITGNWVFTKPHGNVGGANFTANGNVENWSSGTSVAPDGFTLAGAGASVSRDGTNFKVGLYAAALVSGAGAQAQLYQDVDLLSGAGPAAWYRSRKMTFGAWVRATVASKARLRIDDGIGTTDSADHNGNSAFQFLTVTRTLDASASRVRIMFLVDQGPNTAQIDGVTLVFGGGIQDFVPSALSSAALAAPSALSDLTGLTMSNGTDAVNDIDVAVGAAVSEDAVILNRILMSLTSSITKQLDVAWVAGTNQGGRMSAAAITDTTYHVFLIGTTAGAVDVGFDVSPTAPSLPTGYTKQRRIGSIVRKGGTILAFQQYADRFLWTTAPALDYSTLNPGTSAVTVTLTVPTGVVMEALLNLGCNFATTNNVIINVSPLAAADLAPSATASPLLNLFNGTIVAFGAQFRVLTNTSAQIRFRLSASGASDRVSVQALGWHDRRGRG